jgi:hypothetical protein
MKLFRVRGVEDSEMLVRTPASGSIGETMKQPKPVKAWGIVELDGSLSKMTYTTRATARWQRPYRKVIRVEIRPLPKEKP